MENKEYIIAMPYFSNGGGVNFPDTKGKCPCFPASYYKGMSGIGARPFVMEIEKDSTCTAIRGREPSCLTPKRTEYGKQIRKQYEAGEIREQRKNIQQLEPREDGKTGTLTTVQKDNMIMERKPIQLNPAREFGDQPQQQNRYYDVNASSPAMTCTHPPKIFERRCRIRRLTPTECARLQSIPDWYEWKGKFPDGKVKPTSDTQIYKLCGNGWNVEVIKHIFSFIDLDKYEQICKSNN